MRQTVLVGLIALAVSVSALAAPRLAEARSGQAVVAAALVDPYLKVQAALAADKTDGLPELAKAIETAAAALGKDADAIVAGAKKLASAKDLGTARGAFGDVSGALIAYAEKTKSTFGPDVKVAYCPMVNKSWLQKEKEIKNPYYGSGMLTCGNFK